MLNFTRCATSPYRSGARMKVRDYVFVAALFTCAVILGINPSDAFGQDSPTTDARTYRMGNYEFVETPSPNNPSRIMLTRSRDGAEPHPPVHCWAIQKRPGSVEYDWNDIKVPDLLTRLVMRREGAERITSWGYTITYHLSQAAKPRHASLTDSTLVWDIQVNVGAVNEAPLSGTLEYQPGFGARRLIGAGPCEFSLTASPVNNRQPRRNWCMRDVPRCTIVAGLAMGSTYFLIRQVNVSSQATAVSETPTPRTQATPKISHSFLGLRLRF